MVRASYGHVRDLPDNVLGVDTEHDFEPTYVISPEKKDVVRKLKDEAKGAEAVYLATDPDREGEAIAWHLVDAMDLRGKPIHRIEFHEITKNAILDAVQHPRQIDVQRVDAQQARRILDRLVGFKVSQLLWKKVRRGLSAGRVQSVAVRIVADRERERDAFVPVEYWSIEADLRKQMPGTPVFRAALTEQDGKKVDRFDLKTGEQAQAIVDDLQGSGWVVREVKQTERQRNPSAPFTTSTLQQEASRKLGFTARQTMALAQQLYEGMPVDGGESVGLITYMRTDSVTVAETAIAEARETIEQRYGRAVRAGPAARPPDPQPAGPGGPRGDPPDLLGARPRTASDRSWSGPARMSATAATCSGSYDLIWKRFVASQMASAIFDQTTVDVDASRAGGSRYTFRATGSVPRFLGFLTVYREGRDDGDAEDEDGQPRLPELTRTGAPGSARAPAGAALHPAAPALHRGDAGQVAGGARHRPAFHLRPDPLDDPRPRLRRDGGPPVQADRPRLPGQRHAGRQLHRHPGRGLHGRHGGEARRHRPGRAALGADDARVLRSVRRDAESGAARGPARQPDRRGHRPGSATSAASRWRSSSGGSGDSSPAPATRSARTPARWRRPHRSRPTRSARPAASTCRSGPAATASSWPARTTRSARPAARSW